MAHRSRLTIPRAGGFTVLEMMITLSVAAILLIVGIPSFREFGARQRMSAAMHALHGQLALARDSAIRTGIAAVACPGEPDGGCRNGSDWSEGWFIFGDISGDRAYQPGEPVHRVEPGLEQIVIRSSSGRQEIRFYPNGSAPGSNGTITFCDRRGPAEARKLIVSNVGRIRRDQAPDIDPDDCPESA